MKYSVVIPVFNVGILLNRCLDSVIQQEYYDYEIILVDDGSSDDSGSICDEYAGKYEFIKVIHQENQGLSGARNTGIKNAKGDWILFLDSDDYWAADFFSTIDAAMMKYSSDYYKFNYLKVFADREPKKGALIAENDMVCLSAEDAKIKFLTTRLLNYSIGWEVHTGIYKKSIIDKYNLKFIDTKKVFAEDLLFTMNYILHADNVYLICNFLYMYYTREGSLSNNYKNDSILPRLFNLLECFYGELKANAELKKNFYRIYFCIINFHVIYNLKDTEIERIQDQLRTLRSKRLFKKFDRKVRKDHNLCEQIARGRNWL